MASLSAIITLGSVIASLATIVIVIVSPTLARAVSFALLETMLTVGSVGGVRSIVTRLESVTAVRLTPLLLAVSLKVIDRLALPSTSFASTTTEAE